MADAGPSANGPNGPDHRAIADAESRRLYRLGGMGMTLASEVLAGVLIGWGLDTLFGTGPVLLIVFALGGLTVGMVTFIRSALRESRRAGADARRIAAERPESIVRPADNDERAEEDDR